MAEKSTHVMPLVVSKSGDSEGLPSKKLESLFCNFLALSEEGLRSSLRSTAPWGPPARFVMDMAAHKERAPGDGGVCTEQEGVQSGANPSSAAACALSRCWPSGNEAPPTSAGGCASGPEEAQWTRSNGQEEEERRGGHCGGSHPRLPSNSNGNSDYDTDHFDNYYLLITSLRGRCSSKCFTYIFSLSPIN